MPSKFMTKEEQCSADKQFGILQLCSGVDANQRNFYAYVSICPSKYEEYLMHQERHEQLNLAKYGDIIHSGFGFMPSTEVQKEMEEKYKVNHKNYLNAEIMEALLENDIR